MASASPSVAARLAYELAWRRKTALLRLEDWLTGHLRDALEQPLSIEQRRDIGRWLAEEAREQDHAEAFRDALAVLDANSAHDAESAAWANFERCLWARDRLDHGEMASLVNNITGPDPIWSLRRAAVLADLHRDKEAVETARQTLADLQQRRAQDKDSIWIASRLSWALFVCRLIGRYGEYKQDSNGDDEDEDDGEPWPQALSRIGCNAWDEKEAIRHDFREAIRSSERPDVEFKPMFDIGAVRRTRHFGDDGGSAAIQGRRFLVLTGLPSMIGGMSFSSDFIHDSVRLAGVNNSADILRLAYAARRNTGIIDEILTRPAVAQLAKDVVDDALLRLQTFIDEALRRSQSAAGDDKHFHSDRRTWAMEAAGAMEIASRLIARVDADMAKDVFIQFVGRAVEMRERDLFEAWWSLLGRCIESVPPGEREPLLLAAIELPVATVEPPAQARDFDTTELTTKFPGHLANPRGGNALRWSNRIRDLTTIAQRPGPGRPRAIQRLSFLFQSKLLTESESEALGRAIWSRLDANGCPEDTGLLEFALLTLPAPDRDAIWPAVKLATAPNAPLDDTGNAARNLLELYSPNRNLGAEPLTPEVARTWFRRLTWWRPTRDNEKHPWPLRSSSSEALYGWVLAWMVVPALDRNGLKEGDLTAIIGDHVAKSLVVCAPALVAAKSEWTDVVADALRTRVVSADRTASGPAIDAIEEWTRLAATGGSTPPPPDLVSAIAMATLAGGPVLQPALSASARLVRRGQFQPADLGRLRTALTYFNGEPDYAKGSGSIHDNLGLTRAAAVKLATSLQAVGAGSQAVADWLEQARTDPLPEVRNAVYHNQED